MKLPYIFIFDINNTIIGNSFNINHELELLYILHKYCKINNINNNCNIKLNIEKELNKGLLRPYFKDFIDFIKKKYETIELYIYTSSNQSYKWVYSGIISNIEKIINIKFNEPYFTREYYINHKQLLGNIYDIIIDNLISKYPLLENAKYKEYVFKNQIFYLSNSSNIINDFPEKQIIIPKYDYMYFFNLINIMKKKYNFKDEDFNNNEILKYCDEYLIPIYNKNGSILQKNKSFQKLLYRIWKLEFDILNKDIKNNEIYFQKLINIMNKNKLLNNKKIELINNMIK